MKRPGGRCRGLDVAMEAAGWAAAGWTAAGWASHLGSIIKRSNVKAIAHFLKRADLEAIAPFLKRANLEAIAPFENGQIWKR